MERRVVPTKSDASPEHKWVDQTRVGANGNCFEACIASLTGWSIDSFPAMEEGTWLRVFTEWLRPRGYYYFELEWVEDFKICRHGVGLVLLCGKSPRGFDHATVGRFFINEDGKHAVEMLHDPHPDKTGIESATSLGFLVPTFMSQSPQHGRNA